MSNINCAMCADTGKALDTIGIFTYIPCPICYPEEFVLEMAKQYKEGRKKGKNWNKPLHNLYIEMHRQLPDSLNHLVIKEGLSDDLEK